MKNTRQQRRAGASRDVAPEPERPLDEPSRLASALPVVLMVGALLFAVAVRWRLLDVPLERDEGEYAYVGQQLLRGVPPFVSIYHVKLPGTYVAYAAILSWFGETQRAVHLGLIGVNLLTAVALFFVARRIFTTTAGALATACFACLSLSQSTGGFSANAEHFVLLPALLGLGLLLIGLDWSEGRPLGTAALLFGSGLLLGTSYLMKQHGVFFIAFAGLFLIWRWSRSRPLNWTKLWSHAGAFGLGACVPLALTSLAFWRLGLFTKFWWWTWYYPRQYASQVPLADVPAYFGPSFGQIWPIFWPMLALSMFGVVMLLEHADWDRAAFGGGLLLLTSAAVAVGFNFYPHYFLLATPAVAMLTGVGAEALSIGRWRPRLAPLRPYVGVVATLAALTVVVWREREYLFELDGTMVSRTSYGNNPFPESLAIARYIEQASAPSDRIAVIGSEPEIYFYAHRRAATGYVYTYEMMREHAFARGFQVEMADEIEAAEPSIIVMVDIYMSWFATPVANVDSYLFERVGKYVSDHYDQVGIVSLAWPEQKEANYCWDSPGLPCRPLTEPHVVVFKRKGGGPLGTSS